MLEVADIIDELKMMRHLLEKQAIILGALTSALEALNPQENADTSNSEAANDPRTAVHGIAEHAKIHIMKGDEHFRSALAIVDLIKNEAEGTHRAIRHAPKSISKDQG